LRDERSAREGWGAREHLDEAVKAGAEKERQAECSFHSLILFPGWLLRGKE